MAVGDITKEPTGGVMYPDHVTRIDGNTTTMYVADDKGNIKQITALTTTPVLAELTNKVKLPGKIVALCYTGISVVYKGVTTTTAIIAVLADGRVYAVQPTGANLNLIATLNMSVSDAYYYSNYLNVILDGMQQEKSSLLKIQLA